MENRFII